MANNEYRVFGLDRVSNLVIGKNTFSKRLHNPRSYFDGIFGVFDDEKMKIEEIHIEVKGFAAKLIEKVPIHSSQEYINKNGDVYVFRLLLRPTIEVRNLILGLGKYAKVLKPESLVEQIKLDLRSTLAQYD